MQSRDLSNQLRLGHGLEQLEGSKRAAAPSEEQA
jgi:hypothetical protein